MKHTILSIVTAALLAGTSTVALAQTDMTGTRPSDAPQTTATRPGAYNSNATTGTQTARAQHRGMSSDRVKRIQSALADKGQNVKVDGHWGKQTAAAVRKFQEQNGLKATGRVDRQTSQKLGLSNSG